jgi:DNA ligase 1
MAFDMLYFNGESMLEETFAFRRKALREELGELEGKFMFANASDTSDFEDLAKYLDQSVKDCCEGLMVKTLTENSTY